MTVIQRRVFYSFHYAADSWRAATVRNIGTVEGNQPVTGNKWEEVTKGGDASIKRWIGQQMKARSCTVVLVGAETACRRWIHYEITKSWKDGMGLVGIHIHGLLDQDEIESIRGENPFGRIPIRDHHGFTQMLSSIVRCYDPPGSGSRARYQWIRENLRGMVEEAIQIRRDVR